MLSALTDGGVRFILNKLHTLPKGMGDPSRNATTAVSQCKHWIAMDAAHFPNVFTMLFFLAEKHVLCEVIFKCSGNQLQ